MSVELRHLGGALARRPAGAGARATLDGAFALYAVGAAVSPEAVTAIDVRLDLIRAALGRWEAETTYLNFAERPVGSRLFPPAIYRRLREIRARVDPNGLFLASHGIPPAAPDESTG